MSPKDESRWKEMLVQNLNTIDRCIRTVCRKDPPEEREEFRSYVLLRMIRDDYRVLRRYRGQSSIATYLRVVVARFRLDYQDKRWGRWRPSAAACRLGAFAVELERRIHRDGFSATEAVDAIASSMPGRRDRRAELWSLVVALPARAPRVRVGEALPLDLACGRAGKSALAGALDLQAQNLAPVMARALGGLEPEDRLVLKMRFFDCLRVKQIAEKLRRDPKPLYRQIARCLRELRNRLEEAGFSCLEVMGLLSAGGLEEKLRLEEALER